MKVISNIDNTHYTLIRKNVSTFISNLSSLFDFDKMMILDIAPEKHLGAKEHFSKAIVKTLDIDSTSTADYIADLCKTNQDIIPDNYFDLVICTEVLEHVNDPFAAVNELYRIVKVGGWVAASSPFNFRIHNPLPDNWRFTEHGLKILFKQFDEVKINSLEDQERFLMPVHHTILCKK